MAKSYGVSVFKFLRDAMYFPNNFTDLHSYQQCSQSYSFLTTLGFSFACFLVCLDHSHLADLRWNFCGF